MQKCHFVYCWHCEQPCSFDVTCWSRGWGHLCDVLSRNSYLRGRFSALWVEQSLKVHVNSSSLRSLANIIVCVSWAFDPCLLLSYFTFAWLCLLFEFALWCFFFFYTVNSPHTSSVLYVIITTLLFLISLYLSDNSPDMNDPLRTPTKKMDSVKGTFQASPQTRSHCEDKHRNMLSAIQAQF